MKKSSPKFLLEYYTNILFESIVEDGVKVIVPKQMPNKFHKLHTEKDFILVGTDLIKDFNLIKNTYKEYNIFCLSTFVDDRTYPDFNLKDAIFELDFKAHPSNINIVAFICIPKKTSNYLKTQKKHIKTILEYYFNEFNNWHISVTETCCTQEKVLETYDLFDKLDKKAKNWLKKCKVKYSITDEQIAKLVQIIKTHKQSDKNTYKI